MPLLYFRSDIPSPPLKAEARAAMISWLALAGQGRYPSMPEGWLESPDFLVHLPSVFRVDLISYQARFREIWQSDPTINKLVDAMAEHLARPIFGIWATHSAWRAESSSRNAWIDREWASLGMPSEPPANMRYRRWWNHSSRNVSAIAPGGWGLAEAGHIQSHGLHVRQLSGGLNANWYTDSDTDRHVRALIMTTQDSLNNL